MDGIATLRLKAWRVALMSGAAFVLAPAVPALAQPASHQREASATIDEVIVTARKRSESIMATPVIMQALTQQQIDDRRISNSEQLSQTTPGINILNVGGVTGANVHFRGINNGYNSGLDTSFQLVMDGASTSTSQFYTAAFMDVGQIEVLKGPQSLFYGKGASAGILSITSAGPTAEWEGKVTASYEFDADQVVTDAYVSGPITEDLGVRLAMKYDTMKGYWISPNPANNRRNPGEDTVGGRLTLRYNPGGGPFTATLKYGMLHTTSNNGGVANQAQLICTGARPQVPSMFRDDCKLNSLTFGVPPAPPFNPALRTNPFNTAGFQTGTAVSYFGPGGDRTETDSNIAVANLDWEIIDGLSLSSVTSASRFATKHRDTGFYAGVNTYRIGGHSYVKEFSQELRLTSDFKDSWINFMVGAYANSGEFQVTLGWEPNQLVVPGVGTIGLFTENDLFFKTTTYAAFGQVLLTPIESWELALGLRQTRARRYLTSLFTRNNYPVFFNPGPAGEGLGFWPKSATDFTENNTSPEVTLTYRPNSDFTAFASYKHGYKGPAIRTPGQSTSFAPAIVGANAIAPIKGETVKGFEGGVKLLALDRSLSITASAYNYKYKDLQVTYIIASPGTGALVGVLSNGANAKVRGVELGVDYAPPAIEGLTLSAFVAYNDSHFTQWAQAPCYAGQTAAQGCINGASQNLAGRQLEAAPLWEGTLGLDYRRAVANDYELGFNATAKWSGSYMGVVGYNPNGRENGYVVVDAALHFGPQNERWDLALIGRNITNEHYLTIGADAGAVTPGVASDLIAYTNRPRQIAVQASVKF